MNAQQSFLYMFLEPVRKYLADDSITEILVNGAKQIFVERHGKLLEVPETFSSEATLMDAVINISHYVNLLLNEKNPILDARLSDGSRVHVVIPPLSRVGTVIVIRKIFKEKLSAEQLLEYGCVSAEMLALIRMIVQLRKNIIVSGATSSGKMSVLNILSSFMGNDERILVLEDDSELQLQQKHLVYLETRKPDRNGEGEITLRNLIAAALRLRPDRLVIDEIRGGEVLVLLQALNTGHVGYMSTIYANTAKDALSRLETCALLSGIDIPLVALRSQVASAVDVVVHTARLADGSRKIVEVSEVLPLQGGRYETCELMGWRMTGKRPDGRLVGEFVKLADPGFADEARLAGLEW